jgi:fumarylacetoacetase
MAKRHSAHTSWLPEANNPATSFPLTHLPYGVFDADGERHICVAIGRHLLDLNYCARAGVLPQSLVAVCQAPILNPLMEMGPRAWTSLREALTRMLHVSAKPSLRRKIEEALHSITGATLHKAVDVRSYTDFYASIDHARRVGSIFRPDTPLLPNYKYIPIGYHGRASSIIPTGMPVFRPSGQTKSAKNNNPNFGPTRALDFELELAFYIGQPNLLGSPIPIVNASQHLFGISLLNDWSARDIQSWEYQPLGPFLGKSFATTIAHWITPMAALDPFRKSMPARPKGDPQPLAYLRNAADKRSGALDIKLEAFLTTKASRKFKLAAFRISQSNSRDLYWTPAQLVAHHTSNGCNLQTGDILATGTISGTSASSAGCLLEITRNGEEHLLLPTGETRTYLEDGDEVILRGYCEAPGYPRIVLGYGSGVVVTARR